MRRVVVKQEGRVVAEFPLTVGLVGSPVAPVLAAIGALSPCRELQHRGRARENGRSASPGGPAKRKAARLPHGALPRRGRDPAAIARPRPRHRVAGRERALLLALERFDDGREAPVSRLW